MKISKHKKMKLLKELCGLCEVVLIHMRLVLACFAKPRRQSLILFVLIPIFFFNLPKISYLWIEKKFELIRKFLGM